MRLRRYKITIEMICDSDQAFALTQKLQENPVINKVEMRELSYTYLPPRSTFDLPDDAPEQGPQENVLDSGLSLKDVDRLRAGLTGDEKLKAAIVERFERLADAAAIREAIADPPDVKKKPRRLVI